MATTPETPVRSRTAWLPAAAVLLGAGFGANQFTPLLLVYRHALGLGTGTLEAMFGLYALGLIPGLLLGGPLSDSRGRRTVVVPAAVVSLVSSGVLAAGAHHVALLFAGRLLTGLATGAVFAAGTAWLRELSAGAATRPGTAARRAAVAMTAGFALGPLVAGLLAQWAPAPRVVAYAPHLVVMLVVLALLRGAPETVTTATRRTARVALPGLDSPRFRRVVAPMAPWVFTAPTVAFALLPTVVRAGERPHGIALTAAITALCALAGVVVQPLGRRLDAGAARGRAATTGLVVLAAGLGLAAVTAASGDVWLLVPSAVVLGCAYGLCLVAGLAEVQRIAAPGTLAGLTASYYALTYLGFAVPYALALAAHVARYGVLLAATGGLALATAALVRRRAIAYQSSAGENASPACAAGLAARSMPAGSAPPVS
jgi:hypothetical protein